MPAGTWEKNYFNGIMSDLFKHLVSATIKISWTKIHFYNLTSLAYSYEYNHPPADKQISCYKVIFEHTTNGKVYMNLIPCSSWNRCWMLTHFTHFICYLFGKNIE